MWRKCSSYDLKNCDAVKVGQHEDVKFWVGLLGPLHVFVPRSFASKGLRGSDDGQLRSGTMLLAEYRNAVIRHDRSPSCDY